MRRIIALFAFSLLLATPALAEEAWVASNQIRVIDLDAGKEVAKLPLERHVRDILISQDGKDAWVAASDGLHLASVAKRSWAAHPVDDFQITALDEGGRYVAALAWPTQADAKILRDKGEYPAARVLLVDTRLRQVASSFPVEGHPMDLALGWNNSVVYLVDMEGQALWAYRTDGKLLGTQDLSSGEAQQAVSTLAVVGSDVFVAVTSSNGTQLRTLNTRLDVQGWSAEVQATVVPGAGRVRFVVPDAKSGDLWLSSLGDMYRMGQSGLSGEQSYDVRWTGAAARANGGLVLTATTFSDKNGSGAVAVTNEAGRIVKTVELLDLSPYVAAIVH